MIRRITGKTPGTYLRDEIAGPLGVDFHIGLDAKHDARTADLIPAPLPGPGEPNLFAEVMKDPESMAAKAFMNPPGGMRPGLVNTREHLESIVAAKQMQVASLQEYLKTQHEHGGSKAILANGERGAKHHG